MDWYRVCVIKFIIMTFMSFCQFRMTYTVPVNGSNVCNSTVIDQTNTTTYFKNGSSTDLSKSGSSFDKINITDRNTISKNGTIYFCCKGYIEENGKCIGETNSGWNRHLLYITIGGAAFLTIILLLCIIVVCVRRRRKRKRGKLSFSDKKHFIDQNEAQQLDRDRNNHSRYTECSFVRKGSQDLPNNQSISKQNHCSKVILEELRDRFPVNTGYEVSPISVNEDKVFSYSTNYEVSPQDVFPLLHNKSGDECLQDREISSAEMNSYNKDTSEGDTSNKPDYNADYEISPNDFHQVYDEVREDKVNTADTGYEIPDDHLYTSCDEAGIHEDENNTSYYANCNAKTDGYAELDRERLETYASLEDPHEGIYEGYI